jgi:hypothetical protein
MNEKFTPEWKVMGESECLLVLRKSDLECATDT